MAWRVALLAAAEPDEDRRAELLRFADELREVLEALGMPVDMEAFLADFGVLEPE